jgi:hypothetical protein
VVARSGSQPVSATALRAEHRQVVVPVEIRPPLVSGVLVLARLAAALGAVAEFIPFGHSGSSTILAPEGENTVATPDQTNGHGVSRAKP